MVVKLPAWPACTALAKLPVAYREVPRRKIAEGLLVGLHLPLRLPPPASPVKRDSGGNGSVASPRYVALAMVIVAPGLQRIIRHDRWVQQQTARHKLMSRMRSPGQEQDARRNLLSHKAFRRAIPGVPARPGARHRVPDSPADRARTARPRASPRPWVFLPDATPPHSVKAGSVRS